MDIIMIDSKAYKMIMARLDRIEELFGKMKRKSDTPLRDKWLDNNDVCQILNISQRTLRTIRDNFQLPFSKINRKIYYKASDIQKYLEKNYKKPRNF